MMEYVIYIDRIFTIINSLWGSLFSSKELTFYEKVYYWMYPPPPPSYFALKVFAFLVFISIFIIGCKLTVRGRIVKTFSLVELIGAMMTNVKQQNAKNKALQLVERKFNAMMDFTKEQMVQLIGALMNFVEQQNAETLELKNDIMACIEEEKAKGLQLSNNLKAFMIEEKTKALQLVESKFNASMDFTKEQTAKTLQLVERKFNAMMDFTKGQMVQLIGATMNFVEQQNAETLELKNDIMACLREEKAKGLQLSKAMMAFIMIEEKVEGPQPLEDNSSSLEVNRREEGAPALDGDN